MLEWNNSGTGDLSRYEGHLVPGWQSQPESNFLNILVRTNKEKKSNYYMVNVDDVTKCCYRDVTERLSDYPMFACLPFDLESDLFLPRR